MPTAVFVDVIHSSAHVLQKILADSWEQEELAHVCDVEADPMVTVFSLETCVLIRAPCKLSVGSEAIYRKRLETCCGLSHAPAKFVRYENLNSCLR